MQRPKRIDQILPNFSERDAIGQHAIGIRNILLSLGYTSEIFVERPSQVETVPWRVIEAYSEFNSPDNMVIYHYSVGCASTLFLRECQSYIVTNYHNITPPKFFDPVLEWEPHLACEIGYGQMPLVQKFTRDMWTESEFNAEELRSFGFPSVSVFPIIRNYDELSILEDAKEAKAWFQRRPNLLFVGRIVPNKAQHDLITYLKLYREEVDRSARLLLVGGAGPEYARRLRELCGRLNLEFATFDGLVFPDQANVILCGSLTDYQLATVYRHSDAFVCFSDHEGFCVPLIEAMFFGLPILAHKATAVTETCGSEALLVDKTETLTTLRALKTILQDNDERERLKRRMQARTAEYTPAALHARFVEVLNSTLLTFSKR